jgi:TonB family protein
MRVALVGPDYEENLSVRYLSSSLLAAGYETCLAAFNSEADIVSVADAAQQAEIVGLSMCFQSRTQEFLRLARLIKSRDPKKLIMAGGHYASCAAEPLLANHPEIDLIVIHEGERTLVEIADAMPHLEECLPHISGIAYREGHQVRFTNQRQTLDDLDALPFPDRRGPVHMIAGVPTSYLMGSRGCYGKCAYCCITTLHQLAPGKRFRQRNVEHTADEISTLYHERGTRQFVFHDDNFLVPSEAINHARLSAFETALQKRGVKEIALVIKCRPADARRKILRRLKDLGLVRVFLGVESATARGLSVLERSQTVEDSELALETCADLDISAQFTLMIFNPDATLDTLRSDLAFMRRFCGNPLNFCRTEIYAGTPLEKRIIALGRARGNYLARVYDLSDPVADLACNISLDLFASRCWNNGSLMQNAIGLDHVASVAKRFYGPRATALGQRVDRWLRSVNLDTINLLGEVIELSVAAGGRMDAGIPRALLALRERESTTRREFLPEASNLRSELEALRFAGKSSEPIRLSGSRRLARQTAVAMLAIGIPATSGCHAGVHEMAPPPLKVQTTPPPHGAAQDNFCSLAGTVTDPSGAVVPKATITVTDLDTEQTRSLKTNQAGQYAVDDLPGGHYKLKVQILGFRTVEINGIMLRTAERKHVDVHLEVGDIGVCEYVAIPLKLQEDLTEKKKPFTYIVGNAEDHNSLEGIAKLVYGDPKLWVLIFEANRNVIRNSGIIPDGTPVLIPPRKREIPKLISKVVPVYPPAAEKEHVWGDVVLDVTLNPDGTVKQVNVVDGPPLLVEAATTAVKQWRYQRLLVNGKPVVQFVVVVSFGEGSKVQ